jgi:tetratricopeptide (TPR) repeat protein
MTAADDELLRRVATALELRDRGVVAAVELACADRPDLAPQVAEALGVARQLPALRQHAATSDSWIGTVLGERYRLDSLIGAGSMGVVYRAFDGELRRPVAVKLLRSDAIAGEVALARFEREAQALAAISHPAVVTVFDRGHIKTGESYLVMELLDGCSLSALLEHWEPDAPHPALTKRQEAAAWLEPILGLSAVRDPSRLRTIMLWTLDLARGLQAAHVAGVFHRDVKPSNVFIRRDGSAVLVDFGIAARAAEATVALREAVIGTPAYLAPELLRPDARPQPQSDVYGLAATLYHTLTGRPPYAGPLVQILLIAQRCDPVPATRLVPGLPRDLQAILDRALERIPERRYRSAEAFAADVEAFLDHRPTRARPVTLLGRGWRRVRRSRELRAVAAVAFTGAVLISGHFALAAREEQRARAWREQWAGLPPALALAGSRAARVLRDTEERDEVRARLDRAVNLDPASLPTRLLRAAFLEDHGDTAGAAEDIAAVAAEHRTVWFESLASRHAARPSPEESSVGGTSNRVEPSTPAERYAAGFQRLRDRRSAVDAGLAAALSDMVTARDLLQGALDEGYWPAAELLLLVGLEQAVLERRAGRSDLPAYRFVHDLAMRAEVSLGVATATTAYALATALVAEHRDSDALEHFARGLALAPRNFPLRHNRAHALRRLGRVEEAIADARAAVDLRPDHVPAFETLATCCADAFDWPGAANALAVAPYPDSSEGRQRLALASARVEMRRAARLFARSETEEATRAVARATSLFDDAATFAPLPASAQPQAALMRGLGGNERQAVTVLFRLLCDLPTSWGQIQDLAALLPDRLDPEQVAALREYLLALATRFRPVTPNAIRPPVPPGHSTLDPRNR